MANDISYRPRDLIEQSARDTGRDQERETYIERFGPAHALPPSVGNDEALASIAISLKRIADVMEARAAGDFNYCAGLLESAA